LEVVFNIINRPFVLGNLRQERPMRLINATLAVLVGIAVCGTVIASAAPKKGSVPQARTGFDAEIARHAQRMLDEGRETFRYDTFGS
jgi:hypothetical protein